MTLAAGTQIGKYIVRKKLAEGGMAEIYLATSQGAEGFEKEVVIKRIRAFLSSDPGFVDMFIAEARVASRLNHANVVQIFDFEKHEDTYYLAMEYVRGCSLSELRSKCKKLVERLPPVLAAHICVEVARGLHYAHRLKVNGEPLYLVHRDVTPQNILISFDGAVKLTDFGIAKAGNKLTSPGMLKGKFAYMSPEQARGEAVDARTDVFALGVILWEMLTSSRLFQGDSDLAVLRMVQQRDIPPPSRLQPDVPEELSAVAVKALERNPDARYQTAGELERALAQCVLNLAQSPDDTDVAAFVRRVYIGMVPSSQALPAIPERPQHLDGAQAEQVPRPHEPMAMQAGSGRKGSTAGGGEESRPALSPDEDVHASTHMLSGREEGSSGGRSKPSRVITPGRHISAASGERPGPTPEEAAPPRYEATVSLPSPSPAAPLPAAGREAPAVGRRIGLWVGLGLMALLAAVGLDSLLRSRTQAQEPSGAPPQSAAPLATSAVGAPAVATPTPPQQEPKNAGAGTAEAPPVAPPVTPPAAPSPGQSGKGEEPRPAVAAAAKGNLIVRAIPYATVLVDGEERGEVQGQKTFKVAPGNHTLTFKYQAITKTESITIEANGTVKREFRAR